MAAHVNFRGIICDNWMDSWVQTASSAPQKRTEEFLVDFFDFRSFRMLSRAGNRDASK